MASPMTRRGFLAGLGLAAGGGLVAPWLAGEARREVARGLTRLEASRPLLGTWVRIVVRGDDPAHAGRAVEAAFAAIRRVDAQMSIHRADSQLARVNAAAGRAAVAVDRDVLDVVARACDVARRSGEVYDPTVLPVLRVFGFYADAPGAGTLPARARTAAASATSRPDARAIDAARACVGVAGVRVQREEGTLGLAREGMALDLGSIGKGWAADRAAVALREAGVRHALIDVGGNVLAMGTPEEGAAGWTTGLFHPVTGRLERTFVLRDQAVATSANTEQHRTVGGITVGHLFDARRGAPAAGHLSASVVARSGVESDALSTSAFLLGPGRLGAFPEVRDSAFLG
jgi:thiamine biosynthesis lipoprotein